MSLTVAVIFKQSFFKVLHHKNRGYLEHLNHNTNQNAVINYPSNCRLNP
nr:MAG TPA: hypothetical protein [Caudoviricetes sp.]